MEWEGPEPLIPVYYCAADSRRGRLHGRELDFFVLLPFDTADRDQWPRESLGNESYMILSNHQVMRIRDFNAHVSAWLGSPELGSRLKCSVNAPYIGSGRSTVRTGDVVNGQLIRAFELFRSIPHDSSVSPVTHPGETIRSVLSQVVASLQPDVTSSNHSSLPVSFGDYQIPPRSAFIQANLSPATLADIASALSRMKSPKTDVVVLDPPWTSKSVTRRHMYDTLTLDDIALGLSGMDSILLPNAVVAVWVTNDPKISNFVLSALFPQWGVSPICQWAWVKVTSPETGSQPVIPLSNSARKCYERVLVGIRTDTKYAFDPNRIHRFLFSQPCVDMHSLKPSLDSLIDELLPTKLVKPLRVEMFARNVKAGYLCWGDQVLLGQHTDLWYTLPT